MLTASPGTRIALFGTRVLFVRRPPDAGTGDVFTRADATACATQVNAQGAPSVALANQLRANHWIGGVRTILLEESRTNPIPHANDPSNASWSKVGACAAALTVLGPDNTPKSAATITGCDNAASLFQTVAGFTKSVPLAASFWIYAQQSTGVLRVRNSADGTLGRWQLNMSGLAAGWNRVDQLSALITSVTSAFSANSVGNAGYQFDANSGGPLAFYLWGMDQQSGAFPTSTIINASAGAIVRAPDALSIKGIVCATPATLFYRYWNLATGAWVNAVSAYVSGARIVPPVNRAYSHIAVLRGQLQPAQAANELKIS